MTYEVRIVGELAFVPGTLARLRGCALNASRFGGWPESLAPTPETSSDIDGVAVGRWIDDCQNFLPAGERAFLEIETSESRLGLVGLLPDTEFEEWKRPIATLFRTGATVGGAGELFFWRLSNTGIHFGYRIVAEGGTSRVEVVETVAQLPSFPQVARPKRSRDGQRIAGSNAGSPLAREGTTSAGVRARTVAKAAKGFEP